jgi:hypothetical protein
MTILEHVYAIKNIINKGVSSDDNRISNELILHFINVSRVLLLKREADKRKAHNPANFQGLCVPLCESTWVDCCNIPGGVVCPILKSTFKIPRALTGRTNLYIKVSYLSGREIGRTTHRSYRFNQYSLTKKDKPGWFILNDYLYVVGVPHNKLKVVWVDALFEDPTELAEITTCNDGTSPCYIPEEEDYPIDGHLIEPMYQLVLKYVSNSYRFPEDNENNARSNEMVNDKE